MPGQNPVEPDARLPPGRPMLAWRVGVTGHRTLPEDTLPALGCAVAHVLSLVADTLRDIAARQGTGSYAAGGPVLRLVSPLAEGADRLVAREALQLGYELNVAMPFNQGEYERDFGATSLAEFQALLAQAHLRRGAACVLALDGSREADGERGYEAVGRHVLRNCDLLVAVWDGAPAAGRGGTAEVVQAARSAGVPVWWIDPKAAQAPQFLADVAQPQPVGTAAQAATDIRLASYIRLAVEPPEVAPPHRHGVLGRLVHRACTLVGHNPTPLADFLRETAPGRPRIRAMYGFFMDLVAPRPDIAPPAIALPEGTVEAWWEAHYRTASALSSVYGDRYRSSYILVFLLAGTALAAAVLSLVLPFVGHVAAAGVELAALLGIALLVGANNLHRWHERWISYRLLAELCRKQRVLAPLGWTLPLRDVARMTASAIATEPPGTAVVLPREAWVAWYFSAIRRAAPLPSGMLAGAALHQARTQALGLVDEQAIYHHIRHHRSEQAARRLATWGEAFFVLSGLGVAVKLGLEAVHGPPMIIGLIGVACALFPAVSATFVGIRAYAEFELLAQQSARMQRVMKDAKAGLDGVDCAGPAACTTLATTINSITAAMLQDVEGWAQLFQVKAVEAG